jgi:hypothetical protein
MILAVSKTKTLVGAAKYPQYYVNFVETQACKICAAGGKGRMASTYCSEPTGETVGFLRKLIGIFLQEIQ